MLIRKSLLNVIFKTVVLCVRSVLGFIVFVSCDLVFLVCHSHSVHLLLINL